MFAGFPEEAIQFFLGIRYNNDRAYFKEHEDEYQKYVKKPFYDFIDALAPAALEVAPDMEVRPAKCLARIHRDTRFTKDKSPYRDHLWLLFRKGGESRDLSTMYWFELGPDSVNWGLGFWGDNRGALTVLRDMLVENPKRVQKTLKDSRLPDKNGLDICGDSFKRMKPPDGLPPQLAQLYSLKSLYIQRSNARFKDVYTADITSQFKSDMLRLKPMYKLLRELTDTAIAKREV